VSGLLLLRLRMRKMVMKKERHHKKQPQEARPPRKSRNGIRYSLRKTKSTLSLIASASLAPLQKTPSDPNTITDS